MRNELFDKEVNSCMVLEAKIVGNLDHFLCRVPASIFMLSKLFPKELENFMSST